MKDLLTKLNNLREEIEKKQAEITSFKVAFEEYSQPLLKLIEEGRDKLREQCAGPNTAIADLNDETHNVNNAVVDKTALYAAAQEFRTATGTSIVIDRRYLVWNTAKEFQVSYHVEEGKKKGYTIAEKAITEKIKNNEWTLAAKTTFKLNSGCIFVHVVPITKPADVLESTAEYYLGITARGNGVIFFNYSALDKEKLPKKDNPNIRKLKLHVPKRNRYYKDTCSLNQVAEPGDTSMRRYNRRIARHVGIYRAVDKHEVESLVEILL
jgi:hypothetical protein